MFTINAYSVHPLVSRFLTLWRYVEVVTDWVTFFMSCLCCQCLNNMPGGAPPVPVSSTTSVETLQIVSRAVEVDSGRACGEPFRPQRLVVDFQRADDNDGVAQKCSGFWNFVRNQRVLDGLQVEPDESYKKIVKEPPERPQNLKNSVGLDEHPAVHMLKKLEQLRQPTDAFAAPEPTP